MLLNGHKELIQNLNNVFFEKASSMLSKLPEWAIRILKALFTPFENFYVELKKKFKSDNQDEQLKYIRGKFNNSLVKCLHKTEDKALKLKKRMSKRAGGFVESFLRSCGGWLIVGMLSWSNFINYHFLLFGDVSWALLRFFYSSINSYPIFCCHVISKLIANI